MTPYPNVANWPAVLAVAAGVFGMVGSEMLPASMLTAMAIELGVSQGQAGQAVTATAAVSMITSLIVPSVSTGRDRRAMLILCSLVLTAANGVVAWAPDYVWMLCGRLALGLAIGAFWAISAAVTVRLVPERSAPMALSVVFGGIAAAGVLAAPLAAYLSDHVGWRNVFWCASAFTLVCTLVQVATLPRLPSTAIASLNTIAGVLRRPGIAVGIASATSVYIVHVAFQTYLRPFLEAAPGASSQTVSSVFLLLGIGGFIGTSLAAVMMERNLRLTLTIMPALLGIMGLLLTVSVNGSVQQMLVVLVWGCAYGAVPVAWSLWLTRVVPDQRETASAIFVAAVQVAIVAGAGFGGAVFDSWGGNLMYVIGATLVLASSPFVYRTAHLGSHGSLKTSPPPAPGTLHPPSGTPSDRCV